MRIIILSIALLFCAFSAQSQVLKSAGVWYFLDVDSMTARPAVLPNGTELAYVIGTKTVHYWNRATSTWTAYGSTFGRDSIYFDSSIVGSGTVGDPWRVDSTLFATIAGVGDSIAAALGGYFPLEGGTLTGTGGAGFVGFPSQVSAPGTPASGLNVYAQGSTFNWKGTDGYERQIASTLTGGRTYTLPDISGTFALGTGTATRIPIWTSTNALGDSPILYNSSTKRTTWDSPGVIELPMGTDAQRPTATTSDFWYNTTGNGIEWYNGSRWAKGLESTFNRGTSGYLPRFDANGQIIDSEARVSSTNMIIALTGGLQIPSGTSAQQASTGAGYLRWNTSLGYPTIFNGSSTQSVLIGPFTGFASGEVMYGAASGGMPASTTTFKWDVANSRLLVGTASHSFANTTRLVVQQATSNAFIADFRSTAATIFGPIAAMKLTRTDNTVGYGSTFAFYFNNAAGTEQDYARFGAYIESNTTGSHSGGLAFYTTNLAATTQERFRVTGIGRMGINTATPTHRLHVNGRARIDTTDATPTSLIGVDGSNVLGKATLGWGLSMSGGALSTTYPYRLIREDTTISEVRIAKTGGSTNMYLRLGDANSQFTRLILRGEDASYPVGVLYAESTGGTLYTHGFEVDNISVIGGTAKSNVKYIYDDGVATSFFHEANSLILDTYRKVEYRKGRVRTGENYAFRALFSTADTSNTYTSLYNINDNSNTSKYFTKRLFDLTVSGYNTSFYVNKRGDLVLNDSLNRNFSVINGTVKASTYGTGTKEASDLSKTESVYTAWYATDGTVIEKRANAEQYNAITSTSSPQTLSSTIADNLINQGGTQATFTFRLPASPVDGQISKATFANAVTVLTIDGNGTTVTGTLPTTANAGQQIIFKNYTGLGWVRQL